MAIGDDAVAAGMSLVLGSQLANTLDTEDNRSRDFTANGPTYWKPGVTVPITKGGTGATSAAAARTALGAQADLGFTPVRDEAPSNTIGLDWVGARMVMKVDGTNQGEIAKKSEIDGLQASVNDRLWLGGGTVVGDLFLPNATAAVSSYQNAFINGDGRVCRGASSFRYKKDIVRDTPLPDMFAVPVAAYKMRQDPLETVRYGYIAEDLAADPDLKAFVVYDEQERPESFDMMSLLFAQVAQLKREIQELRDARTD